MEVMREARNEALKSGVSFHTMNIKHPSGKKQGGNIIAAMKQLSGYDFLGGEYGNLLLTFTGLRLYRIQFSFCSPNEKNPSRIFGEGQAALRFMNEKSAMVMKIAKDEKLSDGLRQAAVEIANQRRVPWMKGINKEDLV